MSSSEAPGRSRHSGWLYWSAWCLVAAFNLWLRTGFPIFGIPQAAHDDGLFVRAARYLGAGAWLGPYDNLTLAKGMFYPLFILVSFLLDISLNIAEHATYLAASALAAGLVLRITNRRALALVLFCLLALNPVVWHGQLDRVIREAVYISLSLTVVTLAVFVAFPSLRGESRVRTAASGLGLGLVAGAFWLTREEGFWLLPAVAAVFLLSFFSISWERPRSAASFLLVWSRGIGVPTAMAAAAMAVAVGTVCTLNYVHYGAWIANEFQSGPFVRAYGAVSRIKHDAWRRYVVFPSDARQRAYAVSPAARELAPVLDGPAAASWRQTACTQTQTSDCPEILSGWFMWAFRDAVATAGHYRSARDAMAYYDRLAKEINTACDDKRIPCVARRATLMPVFRWQYVGDTARESVQIGRIMLTMADQEIGSAPSIGPRSAIVLFSDIVGDVYPSHGPEQILQGWAASPAGRPTVSIRNRVDEQADTSISTMPGPDVTRGYPDWLATRFDLQTSCPPATCDFIADAPGGTELFIPLDRAREGVMVSASGVHALFDRVEMRDLKKSSFERRALQLSIAKVIAWAYARCFPLAAAIALLGVIVALFRVRSRPAPLALWALMAASLTAVITRTLLLSYLQVTSIPSRNILYASPASPFVIIFIVLGCWFLLHSMVLTRKEWRSAKQ
jgi:hypothetical protein